MGMVVTGRSKGVVIQYSTKKPSEWWMNRQG
jgi:hypothetical protein